MKSIYSLTKREKSKERSSKWHKEFGHLPEVKAKRRETLLNWRTTKPQNYLLQMARSRAKECHRYFELKAEDIIIPDQCPALRTEFEYGTPYAMSVDRINPDLGYTKDNIQIISRKANLMKQNASKEELIKFSQWVLNQSTLS